jgi:hypothetical protein
VAQRFARFVETDKTLIQELESQRWFGDRQFFADSNNEPSTICRDTKIYNLVSAI